MIDLGYQAYRLVPLLLRRNAAEQADSNTTRPAARTIQPQGLERARRAGPVPTGQGPWDEPANLARGDREEQQATHRGPESSLVYEILLFWVNWELDHD